MLKRILLLCCLLSPSLSFGITIVLLGPPASGKGTVAKELAKRYGIPHISSGDIVRAEIEKASAFGLKAQEYSRKGLLLPDTPELMGQLFELLRLRLQQPDCATGFILDGVPRTIRQAIRLETFLKDMGTQVDKAVQLNVRHETLMDRMGGRLTCKSCGATFHKTSKPPLAEGHCDTCNGDLYVRDDDTPEVVKGRIAIYNDEIEPIAEFYQNRGLLIPVNAEAGSVEVLANITTQLDPVLEVPFLEFSRDYLAGRILKYPHPTIPNFQTYNLVEMYKDPALVDFISMKLADRIARLNPDYIAGPEARALPIFGTLLQATHKPGLFVRKAGKLPANAPLLRETYSTAYSSDSIEVTLDPALEGKTVVIVDDGISSGGTTAATVRLLEKAGMKVIRILAIVKYSYTSLCEEYTTRGLGEISETLFDL